MNGDLKEGIQLDIVLDVSSSMDDLYIWAEQYIFTLIGELAVEGKVGTRLGLTVFAGEKYCKKVKLGGVLFTKDYDRVRSYIHWRGSELIYRPAGSALEMALAMSLSKIEDEKREKYASALLLISDAYRVPAYDGIKFTGPLPDVACLLVTSKASFSAGLRKLKLAYDSNPDKGKNGLPAGRIYKFEQSIRNSWDGTDIIQTGLMSGYRAPGNSPMLRYVDETIYKLIKDNLLPQSVEEPRKK